MDSSNALTSANIRFHLFRTLVLPMLPDEPAQQVRPPVVIGAHGGSGTRVLPPALRLAGFWMGSWVNPRTEDAMSTRFFLQRYFEPAMIDEPTQRVELERLFRALIRGHRVRMPDPSSAWGWKNPRSMWVIPFLARLYPGMRFIHLVRDGRDVALSKNLNLLHKHGAWLLGEQSPEADPVRAQLRLWALGNAIAARDGKRLLGDNYLHLSYEELCRAPRETLARMYDHVGQSVSCRILDRAQQLVVPPSSINAWRHSEHECLHRPNREITDVLHRFGYSS
ncbi:sulfotransferase family protein [Halochromatium roseum]|uniref:sulfotransferase family protein n=1 Tax=Halochromatium roseum TaxID=391920 RepID=UPI0019139C6B|nr:sulfotransferase [Halochromatium roseum]